MPPEAFDFKWEENSDVWSLGVVLLNTILNDMIFYSDSGNDLEV